MAGDGESWRAIVRGLDEEARRLGAPSFGEAGRTTRTDICHRFSRARLHGGAWSEVNVSRAWSLAVRHACEAFYAHPWAWNEIGFGGPAYPRGYAAFGSAHLAHGEQEPWEGEEAVHDDPAPEVREQGLE